MECFISVSNNMDDKQTKETIDTFIFSFFKLISLYVIVSAILRG